MNPESRETLEFWAHEDRVENDQINQKIWEISPIMMGAVHDMRSDGVRFSGKYGCQQAMVGEEAFTHEGHRLTGGYDTEDPLPWIPDWVGRRCSTDTGVTVIGPSYPPVIAERGRYWAGLKLADYRAAGGADAFLRLFAEHVLWDSDYGHFCQIEHLLFPFRTAADLCYFNLCRGSFLTQSEPVGEGDDQYSDERLDGSHIRNVDDRRLYHLLYHEYVQAAETWNWERLVASKSRVVIALGKVAEHGLLRLFRSKGARIVDHSDGAEWEPPNLGDEVGWPSQRADSNRPISYWIERDGRWWDISLPDQSGWRLLPVYSLDEAEKEDTGYRRTQRILSTFLNGLE